MKLVRGPLFGGGKNIKGIREGFGAAEEVFKRTGFLSQRVTLPDGTRVKVVKIKQYSHQSTLGTATHPAGTDFLPPTRITSPLVEGPVEQVEPYIACGLWMVPFTVENPSGWGKPFVPSNEPLGTPGGTDPDVVVSFSINGIPDGTVIRSTAWEAGNVDWFDTAGNVFSWGGPRSRYFLYEGYVDNATPYDLTPANAADEIYFEGSLYDTTPGPILGFGRVTFLVGAVEWATSLYVEAEEDLSDSRAVTLLVYAKTYSIEDGPSSESWVEIGSYDTSLATYPGWKTSVFRWPLSISPFNATATESTVVLRDSSYVTMTFTDLESDPAVSFDLTQRDYDSNTRPAYTTTIRHCWAYEAEGGDVGCSPISNDRVWRKYVLSRTTIFSPGTCSMDLTTYLPSSDSEMSLAEYEAIIQSVMASECEGHLRAFPVCADYDSDGNQVFAYRYDQPAAVRSGYETLYQMESSEVFYDCTPPDYARSSFEYLGDYKYEHYEQSFSGDVLILPWTDFVVALAGTTRNMDEPYTTTYTYSSVAGAWPDLGVCTADYDDDSIKSNITTFITTGDGNIRYLDLRHELIVYAHGETEKTLEGVKETATQDEAGGRYEKELVEDFSNRIIIRHGDEQIYEGDAYSETLTETNTPNSTVDCDIADPSDTGCYHSQTPQATSFPARWDFGEWVHWHQDTGIPSEIQKPMDQWYGACPSGDIAISQQIFGEAPIPTDPAVIIEESWHYLYRAPRDTLPENTYDLINMLELPSGDTWPRASNIKVVTWEIEP